ncbi:hypothetical protein ACFLW9_01435 [Chloroflexota bacterium]
MGNSFDINQKDLVYVWLGDLGHIPFKEQQHWKQYNVAPDGGITEHRFKTDFLAEFADPNEPIFKFKQAFIQAKEHFMEKYKIELFLELSEEDSHYYITLHVPTTNEQKELDEQIQNLAKVLNDSLNKDDLDRNAEGSIKALENFLASRIDENRARDIVEPFRMIQNIRSSGVAHRKGSKYSEYIARYGLSGFTNQRKFLAFLIKVTESLKKLALV